MVINWKERQCTQYPLSRPITDNHYGHLDRGWSNDSVLGPCILFCFGWRQHDISKLVRKLTAFYSNFYYVRSCLHAYVGLPTRSLADPGIPRWALINYLVDLSTHQHTTTGHWQQRMTTVPLGSHSIELSFDTGVRACLPGWLVGSRRSSRFG